MIGSLGPIMHESFSRSLILFSTPSILLRKMAVAMQVTAGWEHWRNPAICAWIAFSALLKRVWLNRGGLFKTLWRAARPTASWACQRQEQDDKPLEAQQRTCIGEVEITHLKKHRAENAVVKLI